MRTIQQIGAVQGAWAIGASAFALTLAAPAGAQNVTAVPTPVPGLDQFSLPPGNSLAVPPATPTPTPVPTATPIPTPVPAPVTAPTPSPVPTSTGSAAPARPRSTPGAEPTPVETAAPQSVEASPVSAPSAEPPVAAASPEAARPIEAPGGASMTWWLVLGAGIVAVGASVWAVRRRRAAPALEDDAVPAPVEIAPATPRPPARPLAPAASVPVREVRVIGVDFRPLRLWTRGPDAFLTFELLVTNTGSVRLDGVRPLVVLASASPTIADEIAEFERQAPAIPGGDAFDLAGGETRRVTGDLTLRGDDMHVTEAAGRELIVPVALVHVKWRTGLSIAAASEALVVGSGHAGSGKLGPIWVDRAGLDYPRLDARRFTTRSG